MNAKFNQLVERLIEPRRLVLFACILVAMGLVADYVQVQREVDRTLALRQGPPPAVALQGFRPSQDIGPANEVQVFAEADFSKSVVLTRRGSGEKEQVLIVPLVQISEIGASLIDVATDRTKSALAAQVSRRALSPDPVEQPIVYGIAIHDIPAGQAAPGPEKLAKARFGQGLHGVVVTVNGSRIRDDDIVLMADGAFTALGLSVSDDILAVRPYANGRMAYLSAPFDAASHRWVFGLAAFLVATALFISVGGISQRGHKARARRVDHDVPGSSDTSQTTMHPKFAPIPSQEELSAPRSDAVEEQSNSRTSKLRAVYEFFLRARQDSEAR
jgi:hypothetical protein